MKHYAIYTVCLLCAGLLFADTPEENLGRISPFLLPKASEAEQETDFPPPSTRPKGDASFRLLYEMGASSDPAMRMRALEAWGASDSQEALNQVMGGLLDSDSRVRDVAVRELSGFGDKRVFEFVMGLLAEGDYESVGMLHNALPAMKNQLEDRFLRVFEDEGQELHYRRAAAYALGRMGAQKAREGLAQGAWSEYPEFALACAEALYNIRDSRSLTAWHSLLGHPSDAIRAYAVYGICTTGSMEALNLLHSIITLQIPLDVHLQVEAARCVDAWPAENAIPVLIEAMQANQTVGRVCAEQLAARTGLDFGYFPELWASWWREYSAPPPPMQEVSEE